jgi:1,4-alpha-glucan branching enzyme
MVSEQKRNDVVLRINCPEADEVHLAGDFNHWTVPGVSMHQTEPGCWVAHQKLPEGRHRLGYYAIRWRRKEEDQRTPAEPHEVANGYWLDEYDYAVVEQAPASLREP